MSKKLVALSLLMLAKSASATVVTGFDAFDSTNWHMAHGWTNGYPTLNGWRADHVTFDQGVMTITLDDQKSAQPGDPAWFFPGADYTSGEYRSNEWLQYGRYEVSMKPAKASGVISSFFMFTGPVDDTVNPLPSGSRPWDEIDIEFLGNDTTKVQFNYFANGHVAGSEFVHDLGFDAADSFHTYAFEWRPDRLDWYVDGQLIHSVTEGPLPSTNGRLMMDVWAAHSDLETWAGPFNYTGPVSAQYDWVNYTPLSELKTSPVPIPPAAGSFALGILALAGWKRRQKERSKPPA